MFDWFRKRGLQRSGTKDIPYFNLKGERMFARLCDVYDGDSCTLVIRFGGKLYRVKCRLKGIDTAEIRSSNEDERIHAFKARAFMEQYLDKVLWAEFSENDKYGRALVCLYENKTSPRLNSLLVEEGLAYEYQGGGKKPFEEWS